MKEPASCPRFVPMAHHKCMPCLTLFGGHIGELCTEAGVSGPEVSRRPVGAVCCPNFLRAIAHGPVVSRLIVSDSYRSAPQAIQGVLISCHGASCPCRAQFSCTSSLVFRHFRVEGRGLALTTVLPYAFAVFMPKITRCLCLRPIDQAVDACTVEGSGFASITASPSALAAFVSRSFAASNSANRFCIAATQTSVREAWYHWLPFVPDLQAVRVLPLFYAHGSGKLQKRRQRTGINNTCCLPEQDLCPAAWPPPAQQLTQKSVKEICRVSN